MRQPNPAPSPARHPWLWGLALLFMVAAGIYQRATGPTYPKRLRAEVAGQSLEATFLRSETTPREARVALPDLGPGASARVVYRRFPTADPWTTLDLKPESRNGRQEWAAYLPAQPAAGKLEYHVELTTPKGARRLPEAGEIRLRYKDPVPTPLLLAHVIAMFFGVLFGVRTGLASLVDPHRMARLAWETLALLTVGGMTLGPFVQKYAFGAFWTGWPYGYDLTDNKTLIMWLVWLVAGLVLLRTRGASARWAVGLAALAMAVVYVIPHSARGSQLDYSKLRQGVEATRAITTGR